MKTVLAASAASALLLAGTSLAAQEIDPRCLAAATSQGVAEGYNVRFDAARGACIATPLPGTVAPAAPGVAAGLAGLGGGAGIAAGVVVIGVLAAATTTGGT